MSLAWWMHVAETFRRQISSGADAVRVQIPTRCRSCRGLLRVKDDLRMNCFCHIYPGHWAVRGKWQAKPLKLQQEAEILQWENVIIILRRTQRHGGTRLTVGLSSLWNDDGKLKYDELVSCKDQQIYQVCVALVITLKDCFVPRLMAQS